MPAVPAPPPSSRLASRSRVIALAVTLMAVALAGWWSVVPHHDRAGDSTSLAALLPTTLDGRPLDIMPMPPDDLDANMDPAHKAALRSIAEEHGRGLGDLQQATALAKAGDPRTVIFAIRLQGVPAEEMLPLQWLRPDPSYALIARPQPAVVAGHPVLIGERSEDEQPVFLLRDEILFTFIAPDDATLETMVQAVWDATERAPDAPVEPA